MTSVKSYSSRKEFAEEKSRARSNSLRRISRETEILFTDNPDQDRQIKSILRKVGENVTYRLVYPGSGWCHLQLFVWRCHEQPIRQVVNRLSAYKYYKIKIDLIIKRKG